VLLETLIATINGIPDQFVALLISALENTVADNKMYVIKLITSVENYF
jgi:hypothetical protein